MLEDGQSCDQVLLQLSAVRAALNKATKILLEDHFDNCVLNKNKDKALEKELMEFRKMIPKTTMSTGLMYPIFRPISE